MIIMNANKAPTDDLTLRKVIMHAVNKAAIIDKELFGMAEPVDALFPKNAPYCDVDLTPRWDYDFEQLGWLLVCVCVCVCVCLCLCFFFCIFHIFFQRPPDKIFLIRAQKGPTQEGSAPLVPG